MRYLWVEDFDGDSESRNVSRRLWESHFQLEGKISRIFGTLEEVLLFLEEPTNWRYFDAVLIDIRFPVSAGIPEDEIYDTYFGSFLKKEQFLRYAKPVNNDPSSSSAGVLLFLALVHRYSYSQSRIAFISANVDGSGEQLSCLKRMREYLCKAVYEPLSEEDIADFSEGNGTLEERYGEAGETFEEIPEEMDFPGTAEIGFPTLEKTNMSKSGQAGTAPARMEKQEAEDLLHKLDRIEKRILPFLSDEGRSGLKYDSVKAEFGKVGLLVPRAFEKPDGGGQMEISWQFRFWSDYWLGTEYYRLRSRIIPVCLTIEKAVKEAAEEERERIISPCCRLLSPAGGAALKGSSMPAEISVLSGNMEKELLNLLADIVELFPASVWIDSGEREKYASLYGRILRVCVSLCEKMGNKRAYENSCRAVLKIARNWLAHQGIRDVEAFDVAFLFHLMTHTFFDMTGNPEYAEQEAELIREFCSRDRLSGNPDRAAVLSGCRAAVDKKHREAFAVFVRSGGHSPKKQKELWDEGYKRDGRVVYSYRKNASLYDVISALGNEYSPVREEVSMGELYLLFLENMGNDGEQWDDDLVKELFVRLSEEAEREREEYGQERR